jgi:hypothetical protein
MFPDIALLMRGCGTLHPKIESWRFRQISPGRGTPSAGGNESGNRAVPYSTLLPRIALGRKCSMSRQNRLAQRWCFTSERI